MAKSKKQTDKSQPLLNVGDAKGENTIYDKEGYKKNEIDRGHVDTDILQLTRRVTSEAERQEIFIPLSGFVWLYPEEVRVIDHPVFQRLGRIYQLGHTYLIYRGATHKRLEHAIGSLHIVQRMINAVKHTSDKNKFKNLQSTGVEIQQSEKRFIRLGALLHDIGHIAFGHTIEDELRITCKHDSVKRLNLIFKDERREWLDKDGKTLGELIDEEFYIYIPQDLRAKNVSASQIVQLLIRKHPESGEDPLTEARNALEDSSSIRLNICRDMIGNTICADILDYLYRDWYHIGKYKPLDERILQYMEIHTKNVDALTGEAKADREDKFVIALGNRPKIRTDAVSAILELLEWRYQLAESVLFHRTKLAAAAMIDRALFELWEGTSEDEVERFLFPLSDDQLLTKCRELANEKHKERNKEKYLIAEKVLYALENRQLYTNLCTFSFDEFTPDIGQKLRETYAKSESEHNVAPENRTKVLRLLEKDFNLSPGSLMMYCPTAGMNAKIAEVQIKVNETVDKFSEYEHKNRQHLTGGHLEAQLQRFERLWRIHFFIERKEKDRIREMSNLLIQAIEKLVLDWFRDGEEKDKVIESLARSLTMNTCCPWHGYDVVGGPAVAAYQNQTEMYPFGYPSIRSLLNKPDAPKITDKV